MRKKLSTEDKRTEIIGIKVKKDVKEKIKYLSERDITQMSTYINKILETHIEQHTKIHNINWDEIFNEREEEK